MDAVLIIDKPAGMTSHDVVARVRRITGEKSIGHLGTLDPMATGVLPLVLGRFTRLAQFYGEADKRYEGAIRFGWATDTYDAEGKPTSAEQSVNFSVDQVREAAKEFMGEIAQYPPPFSAKKIAGIPAHRLARKGQPVELKPKQVEIKELEFPSCDGKVAHFKAWVSSGTYLRSLAHDIGKKLGPGAHLSALKRTAVREFPIEEAYSLEQVEQARATNTLDDLFLHPRLVLPEFPAVVASAESASRIRHGGAVNLPEFSKAATVRV
ncbi:MAG TPA: tRNA pseudouridine(55) synthase TruB, partial [Candidatus Angelobacter sp.]|nr:tRNA pseudouridine(55) synthase TruB [Candidatus Angelobacter sp.]